MAKILSNNPERGSNNWRGFTSPGAFRSMFPTITRRGIRRLMKVDPANAQGTPDSQILVDESGVAGRTGATSGVRVMGTQAQRIGTVGGTAGGAVKRIRDRGKNTRLSRR